MTSIFNYQKLKVTLQKQTRTLELESLLAWATTHVEIHTLFIESNTNYLSKGYDKRVLNKLTIEKLGTFTKKLQKINQAIMLLPQTVIIDMQMGVNNIAAELATACDIRIANRACEVKFDHSKLGLVPCSGGIVQLSETVGHGNAKNWVLSGRGISLQKLESTGFVFDSYTSSTREEVLQRILAEVSEQSPVGRIQSKLAVVECVREKIEAQMKVSTQIAKAAMVTEDWKIESRTPNAEMPAASMKSAVKLSLIKSDEAPPLPN